MSNTHMHRTSKITSPAELAAELETVAQEPLDDEIITRIATGSVSKKQARDFDDVFRGFSRESSIETDTVYEKKSNRLLRPVVIGLLGVLASVAVLNTGTGTDKEVTETESYIVQPGDTPWGIAREHLGDEVEIRPLVEDISLQQKDGLQPGDRITLPKSD